MAKVKISLNKDRTITVRVGRAVEHISQESKTRGEVFDQVKYAIISKGGNLKDLDLVEELANLRGQ